MEENKNNEIVEETLQEESVDSLDKIQEVVDEYTEDERKKIKRRIIALVISFTLTLIIYIVSRIFYPFKNLDSASDVQTFQALEYIKYIMLISGIITIGLIVLCILHLCKVQFKITKKVLNKVVDILEWIVIFPICITIASFCFSFVFTLTVVEGNSMNPNVLDGEELFLLYSNKYERFDVVVIDVDEKYQMLNERLFIKRIIGLPGEYIEYRTETNKNGNSITNLYVNGEYVDESFFTEFEKEVFVTYLRGHIPFDFEEICNINNHNTTIVEGKIVIPNDYYLVLGDNRPDSQDSRTIGLVHKDDLIGKVKFRMKSLFKFEKIE
ncbi:MAG: signal peptidase I [Bacilli bacterium]|nr:signal peptidase I [Bacilli bacterium]